MNIVEKLKGFGVNVTDDMQKTFAGDFISQAEDEKKADKIKKLEEEKKALEESQTSLQRQIAALQGSAGDKDALNAQIAQLQADLEKERNERKQKEEDEALAGTVDGFLKDKHFTNEITKNFIRAQLVTELKKDTARGKSVSDIFSGLVNDENGKPRPDIVVDDKTYAAQQKRSKIVGAASNGGGGNLGVTKEDFAKMGIAERTKLKEESPEEYEKLKKELRR